MSAPVPNELVVDDPFTGEVAFKTAYTMGTELDRVLGRSREGARAAAAMSVDERVALCLRVVEALEKSVDDVAGEITAEMGKPLSQAKGEMGGMAKRARHMAAIAKESLRDLVIEGDPALERRIVRAPKGVVFNLPAWNYPLLTAVNAVIPAVLAGNAVVLKHSPRSPSVGNRFAQAFRDAGAPEQLVQAIHTDYATAERIVGDPRIDHVCFTGSVHGGHQMQLAARDRFIDLGLELGGNDAAYVASDADLAQAVEGIVDGACYNAGQSCCAVERVYVHESLYDAFIEACLPVMRAYVMGDPRDGKTSLGPIAQPWHPDELKTQVDDAIRRGAKLVLGGNRTSVSGKGRFFEPTVLIDVPDDALVMSKESFGPLLPVAKVKDDEEALALINADELGLTASIWTKDLERARRFAARVEAGTVYKNRCDALDPALPWTGWKDSGKGSTLSVLGFEHLTKPKALNFRL